MRNSVADLVTSNRFGDLCRGRLADGPESAEGESGGRKVEAK